MNREKNGQHFEHGELTQILYQQSDALAHLQSKDMAHGDVQPLSIAYDPNTQ